MPAKQRVPIAERERQQIRKHAQANPHLKQTDIAAWATVTLGRPINQSIIHKSLSSKFSYLDTKTFAYGDCGTKRVYPADYPVLESALFEWVMHMEATNQLVTGETIQDTARVLWQKMPDFQLLTEPAWSQGWLSGFKRRYNIKRHSKQSVRNASANEVGTAEETQRLQRLVQSFDFKDIFTTDESGLFWLKSPDSNNPESEPDSSMKNMVTILPTCNADGSQKLDLWVIGHCKIPRSFGPDGCYVKKLPFTWRHNKKAWMTTAIFIEYLHWFDDQMHGRKVLLLIDKFLVHVSAVKHLRDKLDGSFLRNTTVEFLPPNPTCVSQPMSQGIINNMKVHYRKAWLHQMISTTLEEKDPYQNTTILTALHWMIDAWKSVTANTISCCWQRSQLFGAVCGPPSSQPLDSAEEKHLQKLAQALVSDGIIDDIANINTFINSPAETITDSYDQLIDHIAETFSELEEKDDDIFEQQVMPPVSETDVLKAINLLLQFEEQQEDVNLATLGQLRHSRRRQIARMKLN